MSTLFKAKALEDFSVRVLTARGADETQARVFSDALIWADRIGRPLHGVRRLPAYVERFNRGLIRCPCSPRFEAGGPSISKLDGDGGFGHFVGHIAMTKAIELARNTGVGLVSAKKSNHFGAAAFYVNMAANSGMLGIATSNSVSKVAPAGGTAPVFGTNPLAVGAPRQNGEPIVFDMATSALSGSSVSSALENGIPLPPGVLVEGTSKNPTGFNAPSGNLLQPFGGSKGMGLIFMVELLSGILSQGELSSGVRSMFHDFSGNGENGHCFIAIDISRLMPLSSYFERLETLIAQIKDAGCTVDQDMRIPGEMRWRLMERCSIEGISLDDKSIQALNALAEQQGVSLVA